MSLGTSAEILFYYPLSRKVKDQKCETKSKNIREIKVELEFRVLCYE